jgi:hypothetical protein
MGVVVAYHKVETTGRVLFRREVFELDHPASFDTGVLGAIAQLDGVGFSQQVGEEDGVARQSTRVELVAALMAEDDLDIFCLVHVGVVRCCRLPGIFQ